MWIRLRLPLPKQVAKSSVRNWMVYRRHRFAPGIDVLVGDVTEGWWHTPTIASEHGSERPAGTLSC